MTKKLMTILTTIAVLVGMFPTAALAEDSAVLAGNASAVVVEKAETAAPTNEGSMVAEPAATIETKSEENITAASADKERATTPSYEGKVEFIGQWVGESSRIADPEIRLFKSAGDKLGAPLANGGLLRGLAKNFLGWSTMPIVKNGELPDGAKLFSKDDTIATAFPNGITDGAKLYGVYYSLNELDKPFPGDQFALLSLMKMDTSIVNENKVFINVGVSNTDVSKEQTLPDTQLVEGDALVPTDSDKINYVVDYYKEKDDKLTVNEVVLNAEFRMNKLLSMLVYKNPVGSNALRPMLSYDYNTRYDNGNFNNEDGKKAGYTYTDLEVILDDNITVPEALYLEFSGYSWRPLYVLNATKEALNVINPSNGEVLGNGVSAFKSLVKNDSPNVRFAIETKGAHKFVVRVVLREGKDEKIAEDGIAADAGQSIADKITKNMTLRVISKAELKANDSNLSEENANKKILTISNTMARELADSAAEKMLKVNGTVRGHFIASAGSVSRNVFGMNITLDLKADAAIKDVKANELNLSYVHKAHNIIYTFVSGTHGKDLPTEVIEKKPKDEFSKPDGTKVALGLLPDVVTEDGIWKFTKWALDKDGKRIDIKDEATVDGDDLVLVGEWAFTAKKTPQNPTTPSNPVQPPVVPLEPTPVPNEPAPADPTNPAKPEAEDVDDNETPKDSKPSKPNHKSDNQIPRTGYEDMTRVYGMLMLGAVALGVIYVTKRRKED